MKKLSNLLKWIDNNLIQVLLALFIFIIPLYPKLPFHMINYTYIAVRLEDFYVMFLLLVFGIQIIRKKVTLNKLFLIPFCLFWIAAFASFFYGYYVSHTIEIQHLGLMHAARRIEYMAVFFVATSIIKTRKSFLFFLGLNLFVLFLVLGYGVGQKFLGWPAVQTMNPEYAKGYLLYLTPEARVSSTFAGHYDLAAYLVFLIPIVAAFYFYKKNLYYFGLLLFSIFILVLTASRISYAAFVVSLFPFLLFLRKPKHFVIVLLITILFTFTSKNLTSRFKRTFQVKQIFVNQNTGQVVVPQKITAKEVPAGTFYVGINANLSTDPELLRQRLLDDLREQEKKKGNKLSNEQEKQLVASMEANLKPVNTVVSDISFATRLQVEWPRAVKAFLSNPVLGTGPSSITEATDNDYLRAIGEFGLFGSLTFALIFFLIFKKVWVHVKKAPEKEKVVYFGFLFGLFGLLLNAGYIDVFEASKVAFFFWMMAGLFIGSLSHEKA
jgi:hypothetical protein